MFPSLISLFFVLLAAPLFVAATSHVALLRRHHHDGVSCTATITSLSDVPAAVKCKNINIESFTVPGGHSFVLDLLDGTTVNLNGDITFSSKNMGSFPGPLFSVRGKSITFNGNNHVMDGKGRDYWDGKGTSSGATPKPHPMIRIDMSGKFYDTKVVESPAHAFSVANHGSSPLVLSGITFDNSEGNKPNSLSNGKPAGANTDAFDVSGTDVTIENCEVINQDDCFALKRGKNIRFLHNTCKYGHGISLGSVESGATIDNILIAGNHVVHSKQALRIKSMATAVNGSVSNITFTGNKGKGLRNFGVIVDQSYPGTLSRPGTGVKISNVHFVGKNNVLSMSDAAIPVAVNCGTNMCQNFNWESLSTNGGNSKANYFTNSPTIYRDSGSSGT